MSQGVIYFNNFFFEDFFCYSYLFVGWQDCGFVGEFFFDIQFSGDFVVMYLVMDGLIYLGMVVCDNEIYEVVI